MKLNKKAVAGVGLGVAALIGGTFAYYNQTISLDNPLSTGNYNTQFTEQFIPPTEELQPGQKWDKLVGAENTGDYPVLVRVKMEEKWVLKNGGEVTLKSSDDGFTAGTYNKDTGIFDADQVDDTDGKTEKDGKKDGTVVYKSIDTKNGWVDGGDGYWYWNGVLEKRDPENENSKSSAGPLMDFLVLANDIDLGNYTKTEYWAIADKNEEVSEIAENAWHRIDEPSPEKIQEIAEEHKDEIGNNETLFRKSVSALDEDAAGYADAKYTLTVTADFVQATTDAVKASWCANNDSIYNKLMSNLTNVKPDDAHIKNK